MSTAISPSVAMPGEGVAMLFRWGPAALVGAAVGFNAVLAAINARGLPIGPGAVIAAEAAIILAANVLAIRQLRSAMLPWYALLLPVVVFAALRWWVLGSLEARYIRDLALIPTFVALGMTFPRAHLPRLLICLHAVVVAGLLLEWASLKSYADLFAIKDYYIATRGATEASFWNTDSNLFVSATRPDDRFFSIVDWHRMSSVFLEPVSLGNYCIFAAACLFAFPKLLTAWQRAFLGSGTLLMLIACDGRLATVTIGFLAVAGLVALRLPLRITALFPLLVLAVATAFVLGRDVPGGADTFPGRVAHTVRLLGRFSLSDILGLSDTLLPFAVDSGIAYLVLTQSVLGVILFWFVFVAASDEGDPEAARFKTSIAVYLSFSMLVSYSFLSIKTAAPLWFVLGVLQRRWQAGSAPREMRRVI